MEKQQSVPDHIQNAGTVRITSRMREQSSLWQWGIRSPVALDGAFKLNEIGIRAAAGTI